MRIEINSNGSSSVSQLQSSVRSLHNNINSTITSLRSARMKINNLSGGAQNLQGAINQLDARIRMEQQKLDSLVRFNQKTSAFIEHAVAVDLQVARVVNQNQNNFFNRYSWLKPAVVVEKSWWDKRVDDWNKFWSKTKEVIDNAINSVVSFVKEHSVEIVLTSIVPIVGSTLSTFMSIRKYTSFSDNTDEERPWFSKIGEWFANLKKYDEYDTKFAREHPFKYLWQSVKKVVLGDYTDASTTELAFAGNIALGVFDLDLPCDVRDLIYDIQHWGEGDHFGAYFALDVIALVPVIGAVKYLKHSDDIGDVAKATEKVADVIDDISDTSKKVDKTVESISETGKKIDYFADDLDEWHSLKSIDEKIIVANKATNLKWVGPDGNSLRVPIDSNSDIAQELKKYNIDGLYYRNGDVDFTPVSHYNYSFDNTNELYKSIGEEITIGRLISAEGVKGRDALNSVVREKWQSIAKNQIIERISTDKDFAIDLQRKTGINVSTISNQTDLSNELKRLGLTLHETPDCTQIQFIPTFIHDSYKHSGGTAEMLERLIDGDTRIKAD